MPQIHPTAIVDAHARLADSVTVGPYAIIHADVRIDEGTSIGSHCLIDDGARIGKNVRVHHGSVVATPPQDLKYAGEPTETFIGDNTEIREFVTINRGTTATRKVTVGSNCLLMAYSHVAHDCVLGDNIILANSVQLGGHTVIGDYAILGGLVGVHQFSHIGAHVMIGSQSRIVKDIPPYALVGEEPVKFIGLNRVGLKRRGFSANAIARIDQAYDTIYYSGMNVSQALLHLRKSPEITPEVETILSFIENSSRGIVRAVR